MAQEPKTDKRAAESDDKKARSSEKGKLMWFPKTDLRRFAGGMEHWKKTGKRFKGAPD